MTDFNKNDTTAAKAWKEGDVVRVRISFATKDIFKDTFKSAKWNRYEKCWELGPRMLKRAESFVEIINKLGVQEEEALIESAEEMQKSLDDAERALNKLVAELKAKRELSASLDEVTKSLAARRSEIDVKAAEIEREKDEIQRKKNEIAERVKDITSVSELKSLADEMGRYMSMRKAWARSKFDEVEARVLEIKRALKAAGLQNVAVNTMYNANYNRPDRDDPRQLLNENHFWAFSEIVLGDEDA